MKLLRSGLLIVAALGFSHSAMAADMPLKAAPAPVPVVSWTGFYLGGHVGVGWLDGNAFWNPLPSSAAFGSFPVGADLSDTFLLGGIHGGYNWQLAPNWIIGIEADWTWSGSSVTVTQPRLANPGPGVVAGSATTLGRDLNWLATVRGRIGTTMWNPNMLVYFTGGGAWGDFDYVGSTVNTLSGYNASTAFSHTASGFVVGAGAEWMWSPKWLFRAEYLFYGLSSAQNVTASGAPLFPGFPSNFVWEDVDIHTVRVGLSYKF